MKKEEPRQHKTRGFTLVELGIVVGVMSILTSSVLAGRGFLRASKLNKTTHDVHKILKAVDSYAIRRGRLIYSDNSILDKLEESYLPKALGNSIIRNVRVTRTGIIKIKLDQDQDKQNLGPELYAYFKDTPNYSNAADHCHSDWENGGYGKLCFQPSW